jgi:hypothetical protein
MISRFGLAESSSNSLLSRRFADAPVAEIVQCGEPGNLVDCAYFERRKVNSTAPSFQLRPPSLDISSR